MAMDPVFLSLLLQSSNGNNDRSPPASSPPDDDEDAGVSDGVRDGRRRGRSSSFYAAVGSAAAGAPPPRPSSRAMIVPREALRPPSSETRGEDDQHRVSKGRKERGGGRRGTRAAGEGEGGGGGGQEGAEDGCGGGGDGSKIRVYRRDRDTGLLELIPEGGYDVVYYDDDDEGDDDDQLAGGGEGEGEGAGGAEDDGVVVAMEEEEEGAAATTAAAAMDVDDDAGEEVAVASGGAADDDDDGDDGDAIYIVRGDRSSSSSPSRRRTVEYGATGTASPSPPPTDSEGDDSDGGGSHSSSSSGDDDGDDGGDDDDRSTAPPPPRHAGTGEDAAAREASALARALASRTEGFDTLRPCYEMLLLEEEVEEEEKQKERERERRRAARSSSSSSGVGDARGGRRRGGDTDGKRRVDYDRGSRDDDYDDDPTRTSSSQARRMAGGGGRAALLLASSVPRSSCIADGDAPRTLARLFELGRRQERMVDPAMHGIELDDWEDGIDWVGVPVDDDEDDDEDDYGGDDGGDGKAGGAGDGMAGGAGDAAASADDGPDGRRPGDGVVGEDCTEDFRPPSPGARRDKRTRRAPRPPLLRHDDDDDDDDGDDPMRWLLEPRNPRLDALDLETSVDWDGPSPDSDGEEDGVDVPLILHSSVAGRSVATLLAPDPTSRPLPFESHPNYQRRYEREMASEITSTAEVTRPGTSSGFGGGNQSLEKYKEARQRKREQMAKDKQSRVTEVMSALSLTGTGRRITSSLMGPGGAERTGRPSRHALGSTSVHDAEYVEQLELVYNHSMVKPELSLSEMRQFHRPRLPLLVVSPSCPWQFQARVILEIKRGGKRGGTGTAGGAATAADGSTIVGSYHAMVSAGAKGQSKIRNEGDLSPTIGDLVILEYSEERPPLFMTKGMTCRIVNYYRGDRSRCPVSAGGGDRPLRKRHGDKAASAKGDAPAGPSNRAERPPRLTGPNQYVIKSAVDLIGAIGSTEKKKGKEAAAAEAKKLKENAIDVLPEGVTEIIHQKVHGPFIGEVEEGKTQSGLICNLFAAPIFRHESKPTDFLMILGQLQDCRFGGTSSSRDSSSGGLGVVLRPFPQNIYCVGQTEPRVKVFAPNTNDEKKFVNAFVPYQIARNIQRAEERPSGLGLTFDDIKDRLFGNGTIPHGQLRMRVKAVANFERTNNGIWSIKAVGEDDFPGVEALGRKVSPEGVAAYESQVASIRRLQDLGVKELYSGGNTILNVAAAMIHLNGAVQASLERRLKMKKVLEIKTRQKSPRLIYFEKAFQKLDEEYREAKKRQEIAKFIYEELQLSPWNITGDFIDIHKRSLGGAMMKLTGFGDPSGLGEAYNFLREADSRLSKSTPNSDGALQQQIKKITGTQNDLRKLTMKQMASLLRSYGMKDKQIAVLKRWDRVHVIRDLSTKAASDGMGDELERFARGEKLRLSDQRQNYTQRIQEIWRRQVVALTADGNEVAARSDLAVGSTKEATDVDGLSDADEEKGDGSNDDSDSSDDDDFFAEMEMEMTNTGETNRLVSGLRGKDGGTLDSQELSKDAREFAALQRQREEERVIQEGLDKNSSTIGIEKPKSAFKVIRRKITKTRPDGTQTVTFEFIVNRDKVDGIIARLKQNEGDEKKRNERKKKKKTDDDNDADQGDTCVGQATFEDEDNVKARRSVKLKFKKETRVIQRKAPGPKKASHFQVTSSIKYSRAQAQENRKKKRMKQEEEADLYKSHVKGKGTSNRKERGSARERMPHVILSERLESVRSAVEERPNVGAFLKPVQYEFYPHYYEIIHEPIDLSAIREKNRKYGYKTADDFVADFALMKNNAIIFNGIGSPLATEAIEIWEFVKNTVAQNRKEFNEMEEAVVDQKNGKKKKKGKSKADSSSKATPMNTANILLDGIETQVNLGTNLSFGLGEDSESDGSI